MREQVIDKGSAVPRVSWGIFLIVVSVIVAGSSFHSTMLDVAERQDKYIDRRDRQHKHFEDQMEALRDDYDSLCLDLSLERSEDICG